MFRDSRLCLVACCLVLLLPRASALSSRSADRVLSLPTFGPLATTQFAGFLNATADGANQLH